MAIDTKLLNIVSSIYDTILTPESWALAGQKIRERYHTVYSGLYVYDVRNGALIHEATFGVDDSYVAEYANEFCFMDPYREAEEFIAKNPHIPLSNKHIYDKFFSIEKNHKAHDYFGEYWHRYDCHHAIGTIIDLPGHLRAGVCAPRSASIGEYTLDEKNEFEHIRKSFHQAMTLSKHIHQLGVNTAALEKTIQFINQAVFIVDSKCRIMTTNQAGQSQLIQNNILKDNKGRLAAASHQLNTKLMDAVSSACNEKINKQSSLSSKFNDGPIEILVCPMQKQTHLLNFNNPQAVVFLLEGQVSDTKVLADIYHLSASERHVTELALRGLNVKQIALARGTSPETVKSQLRSIYYKTNSQNLQDLRNLVSPINIPKNI